MYPRESIYQLAMARQCGTAQKCAAYECAAAITLENAITGTAEAQKASHTGQSIRRRLTVRASSPAASAGRSSTA